MIRMEEDSWGTVGTRYERMCRNYRDAIDHSVERLNPLAGTDILDLGCGTGIAARTIKEFAPSARVSGLDRSAGLIDSARILARRERVSIRFRRGDAVRLPYADARFDGIISTFGVSFVDDADTAATELTRVCRKGGRMVVTAWAPDPAARGLSTAIAEGLGVSAPPWPLPGARWANPRWMQRTFGRRFSMHMEKGISYWRAERVEDLWTTWVESYGPIHELAAGLGVGARARLRKSMMDYLERYRDGMGVSFPRTYVLTRGIRK